MIRSLYPQFQRWSDKGSIYIVSDTHFEDRDCKLMDPKWISPREHIERLSFITKNDTLIHLGDVGNPKYLDELKCYKVLITGNHDVLSKLKGHFDEVYTGPLFIADRILLSHEPISGLEDICVNIHGHNHSGRVFNKTHINAASNLVDYCALDLGLCIKRGILSEVENYHRKTIDKATEEKKKKLKIEKEYEARIKEYSERLVKELKEIYPCVDFKFSPVEWQPDFNRASCQYCPNNPKNGGTGYCHCILGSNVTY